MMAMDGWCVSLAAWIALYRELGGGWTEAAAPAVPTAASDTPQPPIASIDTRAVPARQEQGNQ